MLTKPDGPTRAVTDSRPRAGFTCKFEISLTEKQHGLVAQFAVQSGRTMEDALYLLLDSSIYMLHCQQAREAKNV